MPYPTKDRERPGAETCKTFNLGLYVVLHVVPSSVLLNNSSLRRKQKVVSES